MQVSTRGQDPVVVRKDGRTRSAPLDLAGRLFELECRETLADLDALEDVWRELERRCPEPFTYFQSFEWCRHWCQAFLTGEKPEARLKLYVLWDAGACIMILPLMTRRISPAITLLVPLTAPVNQYSTVLYDPERFDRMLGRAVFDEIRKDKGHDAICFDHVPQSSLLAEILAGEGVNLNETRQSCLLDLTRISDWESHHRALPKKQRLQRNSRRNRLEKLGMLDYHVYPAGSEGYAAHIDRCISLKQSWLKGTGRVGRNIFDPRFLALLRQLGALPLEGKDGIYLHVMTLDGTPIAMEIGMRLRDHYYCFLGAIDLDYQKYSPGKVQMESAQRWAIETGIRRFDFLNDPSTYKSSWTDTIEPLTACYMPQTALGQLYCRHWMAGLRPRVRSIYDAVGAGARSRVLAAVNAVTRVFSRQSGTVSLVLLCLA